MTALIFAASDKGGTCRSVTSVNLAYRQHVTAAADLAFGGHGIVSAGVRRGHDEERLRSAVRFVRAAVPDPTSPLWSQLPPSQAVWLLRAEDDLRHLASSLGMGCAQVLGSVPFEPVLHWREQLITEEDVLVSRIAGRETWEAFGRLADRLTHEEYWGPGERGAGALTRGRADRFG
ncbi:hypothetical protein ACIGFK_03685 [Streptomyces sp. NPDC085524]|uniref:hypothetical protein n=1 Tax=Streptomyces sp. NPDC085524 TaxID=3365728 RepID=UPI0037CFED6D